MKRQSNIELLRIVAMVFIIAHHYALHGGIYYNTTDNIISATFLVALGKLGVNLFVLITGYFMINSSFRIMRIIRLEIAVLFYSIGMFLIAVFVIDCETITFLTVKGSLLSTLMNNDLYYWFIPCYMGVLLLSPFINKVICCLSRKQFEVLLTILFVMIGLIPSVLFSKPWYDGNMFVFVLLYLAGGYIRKYNIGIYRISNKFILPISAFLYMTVMMLTIFIRSRADLFSAYGIWPERLWECASVFIILLSILIFIFFKRLNVKHSPIINTISSATIGVYLLHDNTYSRMYIWKNIFHTERYINSDCMVFHAIFCIIIVFAIGTLVELLRAKILKPFIKRLEETEIVGKIDSWMDLSGYNNAVEK